MLAFDKTGVKPKKRYRIAYLTECINNPYCGTRLKGMKAAAKKYGFTFKIYDANFNPATQLKLTQDAATRASTATSSRRRRRLLDAARGSST